MMARKEEHPWPARVMHWIHLLSMILLAFSGFYIHRPFFPGAMGTMRLIHFVAMYVVLINLVVRIYWAFLGSARDWRDFWLEGANRGKFFPTIGYYLFIKREHPATGKYNPLQKLTYDFWVLLLVVQGITGFALYQGSIFGLVDAQATLGWLNQAVGGMMTMRMIHYLIMWVFIITTGIHVYLSLAEEISQFWLMLFGVETKEAK